MPWSPSPRARIAARSARTSPPTSPSDTVTSPRPTRPSTTPSPPTRPAPGWPRTPDRRPADGGCAAGHTEKQPGLGHNLRMSTSTPDTTETAVVSYHDILSDDGTHVRAWTNDPDGLIDGPTVVLCNGLGTNAFMWPALLEPDCGVRVISWN